LISCLLNLNCPVRFFKQKKTNLTGHCKEEEEEQLLLSIKKNRLTQEKLIDLKPIRTMRKDKNTRRRIDKMMITHTNQISHVCVI
jgi:hypothetical protein